MPDFILSTGGKPWIESFRNEKKARKAVTYRGYKLTSIELATAEAKEKFERERADRGEGPESESPKPGFKLGNSVVISILCGVFTSFALSSLICFLPPAPSDGRILCDALFIAMFIIVTPIVSLIVLGALFVIKNW